MSNDIKPGDLVMVVRGISCCGSMGKIKYGRTFTLSNIKQYSEHANCRECGRPWPGENYTAEATDKIPLQMLKKIDPPAEGDSLPTCEELEIPA